MGNKKRVNLKRKRTFRGNQWNKTPTPEDENVKHVSVSASKVSLEKVNLPVWIYDIIKKEFEELSDDNLLRKCTHGQTQNSNEGLNSIMWSRCPKNIFIHKASFELGVNFKNYRGNIPILKLP